MMSDDRNAWSDGSVAHGRRRLLQSQGDSCPLARLKRQRPVQLGRKEVDEAQA